MKIDLRANFWSKINIKMILELSLLLLFNFIFFNPYALTATIAYIHRIRVIRSSYKLLNKAIAMNDVENVRQYTEKIKLNYDKLNQVEIQLFWHVPEITLESFEQEEVEKPVYNENVEFKFTSIERSVLGIFLE